MAKSHQKPEGQRGDKASGSQVHMVSEFYCKRLQLRYKAVARLLSISCRLAQVATADAYNSGRVGGVMPYETVTLEIADRVATLRLNRPRALNALSRPMLDEMAAAVEE